jgi:hypothetical protein
MDKYNCCVRPSLLLLILKLVERAKNRPPLKMRHLRSSQKRSRRFPFPEVWRSVHWYTRAYISQGPAASIFTVVNEVCKWYISARVSDELGACNGDPRRQLPRCHVPKQENRLRIHPKGKRDNCANKYTNKLIHRNKSCKYPVEYRQVKHETNKKKFTWSTNPLCSTQLVAALFIYLLVKLIDCWLLNVLYISDTLPYSICMLFRHANSSGSCGEIMCQIYPHAVSMVKPMRIPKIYRCYLVYRISRAKVL